MMKEETPLVEQSGSRIASQCFSAFLANSLMPEHQDAACWCSQGKFRGATAKEKGAQESSSLGVSKCSDQLQRFQSFLVPKIQPLISFYHHHWVFEAIGSIPRPLVEGENLETGAGVYSSGFQKFPWALSLILGTTTLLGLSFSMYEIWLC